VSAGTCSAISGISPLPPLAAHPLPAFERSSNPFLSPTLDLVFFRENLDKSVLRKAKPKRKEGYQPLNREALAASARQRWLENEERKSKLRELEEGWARAKKARADKLDVVMDAVKSQRKAAEARRMLWLLERSEEWIPEENLDLAIAAAILEPTEF